MIAGFHINCAPMVFCLFGSQDGILSNFYFITLQSHHPSLQNHTIAFIIAESYILQSGEISGFH